LSWEKAIMRQEAVRIAGRRTLYPLTELTEPRLRSLCEEIRLEPHRLDRVAAIIRACASEDNVLRVSSMFLEQLSRSIDNRTRTGHTFLNLADGKRPINWMSVFVPLRLIAALRHYAHPCLDDLCVRALLRDFNDLERFEKIHSTGDEVDLGDVEYEVLLKRGARLYESIEQDGVKLDRQDFENLRNSSLLNALRISAPDNWYAHELTAIRPSAINGDLYVSTVTFRVLEDKVAEPDGGRLYITSETFIEGQPDPVSEGFVIAQKRGTYVLGHQKRQLGFNFTGFDASEFDEPRRFFRGVLLAANRGGDTGPMVCRVALTPSGSSIPLGNRTCAEFVALMDADQRGDIAREMIAYVHNLSEAELAVSVNGGPTEYIGSPKDLMKRRGESDVHIVLRRPISPRRIT
jgi:hypothetical protein